jgi:SAM-dependent methyltransferase
VDITKPSVARVYDCYLGGKDNFAVDRAVVENTRQVFPADWDAARGGLDNRAFLRRVVRHLVIEGGIRQFIDFGSGLPTQGNVHEIAQDIAPQTRVVYVDNDPIVLVHARALLGNTETTQVITADLRRPAEVLDDIAGRDFVDLSRPIGLLLFAIVHHINDEDDPGGIAAQLRSAMVPGSYLAVSHFCNPGAAYPEEDLQREAGHRPVAHPRGDSRLLRRPHHDRARPGAVARMAAGSRRRSQHAPDLPAVRRRRRAQRLRSRPKTPGRARGLEGRPPPKPGLAQPIAAA